MRIGLVIYGSLDTLSGGYLYDRTLVAVLRADGESVAIVSLPRRNYLRNLGETPSTRPTLALLTRAPSGSMLQDELNHPP